MVVSGLRNKNSTAADAAAGDKLGWSVATADAAATMVVGAPHGGNSEQGAAYVFARSNGIWTQQAKLTASDGVFGDESSATSEYHGDRQTES